MWKSESDIKGKHSSERSEFSRISLNAFRMTSELVSVPAGRKFESWE